MKSNIICDLDGTLALDDHRRHLIQSNPANRKWDEYFSLCTGDAPNMPIISLLHAMKAIGYDIHILSGRVDTAELDTKAWLQNCVMIPFKTVRLRPYKDRTDDHVLKLTWAKELGLVPSAVQFVLEDRQRVVDAWRAAGYTCLQVAPGNF